MDRHNLIDESISYIENNLQEPLCAELLAARVGYSTYHFCKLFSIYKGMPVMEYIRRRRLAMAVADICEKNRILDVATNYGFESHNGFTKAFKKVYGLSPKEFRKRVASHRPLSPNPLRYMERENAPTIPAVRIEKRDAFYIACILLKSSDDVSSISQQPALWQNFQLQETEHRLYALTSPKEHGEYYISVPSDGGLYNLFAGVKADNPDTIDERLFVKKIPSSEYAIFTTPPCFGSSAAFAETITETWQYIFSQWLSHSGYTLNPEGFDFEFYDERCHGVPYVMDIYLPIKKEKENENV